MAIDKQNILAVAQETASTAGNYLKKMVHQRTVPQTNSRNPGGEQAATIEIEFKGDVDLVTECDRESQRIICKILQKHFPTHSILAEEDLHIVKDEELLWVIDPLDGTTNFAHLLPMFCVSIAFQVKGITQVGVVYAPLLDEMFYAVAGGGAFLNGNPIHVTDKKDLGKALLATGFPYDRKTFITFFASASANFLPPNSYPFVAPILIPLRSSIELISFLNQPANCAPVLPPAIGTIPKG